LPLGTQVDVHSCSFCHVGHCMLWGSITYNMFQKALADCMSQGTFTAAALQRTFITYDMFQRTVPKIGFHRTFSYTMFQRNFAATVLQRIYATSMCQGAFITQPMSPRTFTHIIPHKTVARDIPHGVTNKLLPWILYFKVCFLALPNWGLSNRNLQALC